MLDPAKVRSRRIDAGYTERTLSGFLGVSNRVIDRLEEGRDQSHLDVRLITKLAEALAVTVAELLVEEPDTVLDTDQDECQPDDVALIGALVARTTNDLYIDLTADALNWTRPRTIRALHDLDRKLTQVGQRLSWLGDYSVRRCTQQIGPDLAETVGSRHVMLAGLNITEAKMLHQLIATGTTARIGDWDRWDRRRLLDANIVTLNEQAPTSSVIPVALSDNTRFALALDDLPP